MAPQGRLLQIRYDSQMPKNHLDKEDRMVYKGITKDQKQGKRAKSLSGSTKPLSTRQRSWTWASSDDQKYAPTIIVSEDSQVKHIGKHSSTQIKVETPRKLSGTSWTSVNDVYYTTIQAIAPQKNESKCTSPQNSPERARKFSFCDMQGTNVQKNQVTYQKTSLHSLHPGSIQAPSKSCEDLRRISTTYFSTIKAKTEPKHRPSRPSVYEEEPFYLCPENGSFRRRSWQFGLTHNFDKDIDTESVCEQETPLSEILPPVMLPSIYAQECMKEKTTQNARRKHSKQVTRKESIQAKSRSNSAENITKNLMDCRYLRIPKMRLT